MSLEHILLGMLREPAAGYDLKVEFDQGARHFWSAELSQIYPTLQKMSRRGWLKSQRQKSAKGPDRKVYSRTAKGARELRKWLASGPILGSERFAYIAQLVFLVELADLRATRDFLVQLRDKLRAFHDLLAGAESEIRGRHPDFPDGLDAADLHDYFALRLGVRSLAAKADACTEGLAIVEARLAKEPSHA